MEQKNDDIFNEVTQSIANGSITKEQMNELDKKDPEWVGKIAEKAMQGNNQLIEDYTAIHKEDINTLLGLAKDADTTPEQRTRIIETIIAMTHDVPTHFDDFHKRNWAGIIILASIAAAVTVGGGVWVADKIIDVFKKKTKKNAEIQDAVIVKEIKEDKKEDK